MQDHDDADSRQAAPAGNRLPLTIVTSIAPKELPKQQRAVDSWLALGFRVVSLNISAECDVLEPAFPAVEFCCPPRDGSAIAGKPLVYFDDILAWYREREEQAICGIVNSDIVMAEVQCAMEVLRRAATGGMVISSRIDVATFNPPVGKWYPDGYDLFFFDRTVLHSYAPSNFMLGMPWWDYWAPSVPLLRGFPVRRLTSPLIYHEQHPPNYSKNAYFDFAREYIEKMTNVSLAPLRSRLPSATIRAEFSIDAHKLWDEAFNFLREHSTELPVPAFDVAALEQSARWLNSNGHEREALKLLNEAAKIAAHSALSAATA